MQEHLRFIVGWLLAACYWLAAGWLWLLTGSGCWLAACWLARWLLAGCVLFIIGWLAAGWLSLLARCLLADSLAAVLAGWPADRAARLSGSGFPPWKRKLKRKVRVRRKCRGWGGVFFSPFLQGVACSESQRSSEQQQRQRQRQPATAGSSHKEILYVH